MNDCIITFRSVTSAQKGLAIIEQNGIPGSLHRTPASLGSQGCGYCIHVPCPTVKAAAALLRNAQVPYRKAYVRGYHGGLEELR